MALLITSIIDIEQYNSKLNIFHRHYLWLFALRGELHNLSRNTAGIEYVGLANKTVTNITVYISVALSAIIYTELCANSTKRIQAEPVPYLAEQTIETDFLTQRSDLYFHNVSVRQLQQKKSKFARSTGTPGEKIFSTRIENVCYTKFSIED